MLKHKKGTILVPFIYSGYMEDTAAFKGEQRRLNAQ